MAMSSEKSKGSSGENSLDISSPALVEEKGSRNKRKFTSDPPVGDLNKPPSCSKNECEGYEFSADRFQNIPKHEQCGLCDTCRCNQENPDASKLEPTQSHPEESATLELVQPIVEQESKWLPDADWSDLTETQLEELCLNNLDLIFKSVVKTIVASGYSEDVATKAVLRVDLSYGCKDTMSNVVDNTLAVLESGRELDASREHIFENLEQLEKYILAEMVCVLREVNPHFNTGDAMWCLLIYDMNVSLACAMDGDSLSSLGSNEAPGESSSATMVPKLKEDITEDINPSTTNTNSPVVTPKSSQSEMPAVKGIPNLPNPCERRLPEKTNPISTSDNIKKALAVIDERIQAKSQSNISAEKPVVTRKGQASGVKRETILRQKIQCRGAMRTGKLSGLNGYFMDKKLKSVSDSIGIHSKNASMKIKKAIEVNIAEAEENFHQMKKTMEVTIAQAEGSCHLSVNVGTSKSTTSKKKTVNNSLVVHKDDTEQARPPPSKGNAASNPTTSSAMVYDFSHYGIPYDKATGKWVPNDKQDAAILKLVAKAQELQNQLGEWTDWANQKVMQATRRLSKDKAELKALKQDKEEVERIQKERQSQEEGNVKQLSEMENALSKATGQVEKADATVRKLEVENLKLKQGMEEAKKRYAEASESYREASRREKKITKKLQSLERQNTSLQEDLAMLKRRRGQLEQEVEQAQKYLNQLEVRQKQLEREKEQALLHVEARRKEREQIEASAKLECNTLRMRSGNELQRHQDNIRDLQAQIFRLRLKISPSKMAALHWGTYGSHASCPSDGKDAQAITGIHQNLDFSEMNAVLQDNFETGHVKRERECVMCLTEEMSVVFLPCAHQVVCTSCNELHEKQGMKDCPSCRTPIQQRICARFLYST